MLLNYPDPFIGYKSEWLDFLESLTPEEIFLFDTQKQLPSHAPKELLALVSEGAKLSLIKNRDWDLEVIPEKELVHIKGKKTHEICALLPLIRRVSPKSMIDIGGGIGYLAHILSSKLGIKVTTIDSDVALHQTGKNRFHYNPKLHFYSLPFVTDSPPLRSLIKEHDLILGLHTCGPLASTTLKEAVAAKSEMVINFGCCYLRIKDEDDLSLSTEAKKRVLPLSNYALTLASRSHAKDSKKDYLHKKRVKLYRYGLHLFLYHELNRPDFFSVGDSRPPIYDKCFSDFVEHKLSELGINQTFSKERCEKFFKEHSSLLERMFLANTIRWIFGRPLELYLLADRALFLEECGYHTSLLQCFDEKISPRNIAIIGKRNGSAIIGHI